MSTITRKESRLYLRSKEATPGTEDTYDFFETKSVLMTKPGSVALQENGISKLGSGEFAAKSEIQAVYTPFSVKCARLSEVLYFLSFFQGKLDSVETITTGVYSHRLSHLAIESRQMPTFTAMYFDGELTNLMTHCLITDFSLSFSLGGSGVVEALFNGLCNMHKSVAGVLTKQTAATPWSSGAYTATIAGEPLIKSTACKFYIGTSLSTTPLVQADLDFTGSNLSGTQDISEYINNITITGNNGISAEEVLRASGDGIVNDIERKDFSYSLEINLRKDSSVSYDDLLLTDAQRALEIQYNGKEVATGYPYALGLFFPKIQMSNIVEDDEAPINQTLNFHVFADSNGTAFEAFAQNAIDIGINAANAPSSFVLSGWWAGEDNALDSSGNGYDGVAVSEYGIGYYNGFVGRCFFPNDMTEGIRIPHIFAFNGASSFYLDFYHDESVAGGFGNEYIGQGIDGTTTEHWEARFSSLLIENKLILSAGDSGFVKKYDYVAGVVRYKIEYVAGDWNVYYFIDGDWELQTPVYTAGGSTYELNITTEELRWGFSAYIIWDEIKMYTV